MRDEARLPVTAPPGTGAALFAYPIGTTLLVGGGRAADPPGRTAGHLGAYAAALAAQLPAQTPVVLACQDRYAFAAALLGAWSRGCDVHLPPNVQPETVLGLQRATGASTILHDQAGCAGLDLTSLEPTRDFIPRPLPALPGAAAPAGVVVYTSGTQGRPTPHRKTRQQLLSEAAALAACFDLAGRTFLSSVPCHHIYGLLFGLLAPLCAGGRIVRGTPLFPEQVAKLIENTRADVWVTVPPHLIAFCETDPSPLARLHRLFSSGSPLPAAVAARFLASAVSTTQVFGSTETGGIAFRQGTEIAWRPLPGVEVGVSPDGRLLVDSPWLAPDQARPMATQDRARREGIGFVHEGRADAVVKVGGRRVDLSELEFRLGQVPGVRQARAIDLPGAGAHGVEILAVVESSDPTLDAARLRAELGRSLDAVSLPRRIRVVEKLPTGPTGKVSRESLLALFELDWTIAPQPLGDATWSFRPSARLGYFKGHFRSHPVLPAVVQLQRLALALARRRWSDLGPLAGLNRVKFRRPIVPEDEVIITLERPRPAQVRFVFRVGDQDVSSGSMSFVEGPAQTQTDGET